MHFFIMADANFPFSLTFGKLETQTFVGLVIENLALRCIFGELKVFFHTGRCKLSVDTFMHDDLSSLKRT